MGEALGPGGIDAAEVSQRIALTFHDMGAAGQVNDRIDAIQRARPVGVGADIANRSPVAKIIATRANGQPHRQAGRAQVGDQAAADESGRTGDQYHRRRRLTVSDPPAASRRRCRRDRGH